MNEKSSSTTPPVHQQPDLRLVCSELWGGNQRVHRPIDLPGIRGVLFSQPCDGGRGGDVHYLSVCGSGLLSRACLADVVGHGETVAATSSEMHDHLRRCMNDPDQRRVLTQLNTRLCRLGLKAMTTAATVTYYPPSKNITFSYAGHPPAWFFHRRANEWRRLELAAAPGRAGQLTDAALAILPDASYTQRAEKAAVGDRLVIVTDGVLEAPAPDGSQFGDDRMTALLQKQKGALIWDIGEAILAALTAHCGRLTHDDVTFLILEVVPGPKGPAIWHAIKNRILRPRGNSASA